MKSINGEKLKEKMEQLKIRPVSIDVFNDYKACHISGALNIPYNDTNFVKKIEMKFKNKSDDVILCCDRTKVAEVKSVGRKLEKSGYKNVYQYILGEVDWKKSGLRITQNF